MAGRNIRQNKWVLSKNIETVVSEKDKYIIKQDYHMISYNEYKSKMKINTENWKKGYNIYKDLILNWRLWRPYIMMNLSQEIQESKLIRRSIMEDYKKEKVLETKFKVTYKYNNKTSRRKQEVDIDLTNWNELTLNSNEQVKYTLNEVIFRGVPYVCITNEEEQKLATVDPRFIKNIIEEKERATIDLTVANTQLDLANVLLTFISVLIILLNFGPAFCINALIIMILPVTVVTKLLSYILTMFIMVYAAAYITKILMQN